MNKKLKQIFDTYKKLHWYHEYAENGVINFNDLEKIVKEYNKQQVSVEPVVKPEIAETLKKMKQEYLRWLTLPRYQVDESDEYYADIQAITENLQTLIDKIK